MHNLIFIFFIICNLNTMSAELALTTEQETQLKWKAELKRHNEIRKNVAISIANSVIQKKCDPNAIIAIYIPGIMEHSTFPIQKLSEYDDLHDLIEQVIERGANSNAYDTFPEEGDPTVIDDPYQVEKIINYKVDRHPYPEFNKPILFLSHNRPLNNAVSGLHLNTAKVLLTHGADPNRSSWDYGVPLHQLISSVNNITYHHYGKLEEVLSMARLLLKYKISISIKNKNGHTPFEAIQVAYCEKYSNKKILLPLAKLVWWREKGCDLLCVLELARKKNPESPFSRLPQDIIKQIVLFTCPQMSIGS